MAVSREVRNLIRKSDGETAHLTKDELTDAYNAVDAAMPAMLTAAQAALPAEVSGRISNRDLARLILVSLEERL